MATHNDVELVRRLPGGLVHEVGNQVEVTDENGNPITPANPFPVSTSEAWAIGTINDVTLDDSSKDFPVPVGYEYQILSIWVEFLSTATAGNRQLAIQAVDVAGGQVIATWARAGVVQGPGITRKYLFAPGVPDMVAFRDTDYLTTPIPIGSFLMAGQLLRVYDNKAIDAGADHMIVRIQIAHRQP